jgi:UDP-3-O-[3-hydroxymyristoyl] glucosamine N-acyltransferase
VLHSHVSIFSDTHIGAGTIVEPHACIGQFGHGWEWGPDGRRWNMPQLGGTRIGRNCYVGASSVISRGALQDTILEDDVRVAENSLIGHNSHLKEGAFVANGVSMAGMTTIGRRCWLGTGCTLCNQVTLGDNITVGAGAVVAASFTEDNLILVGVPAKVMKTKTSYGGQT